MCLLQHKSSVCKVVCDREREITFIPLLPLNDSEWLCKVCLYHIIKSTVGCSFNNANLCIFLKIYFISFSCISLSFFVPVLPDFQLLQVIDQVVPFNLKT